MRMGEVLSRIRSKRKREEILDILNNPHPAHFQKVFLVGFLRYAVGLSCEEVTRFILENAKWRKKDPGITAYQVRSVRKQTVCEKEMKRAHLRSSLSSQERARERSLVSSQESMSTPGEWLPVVNECGFVLEWIRKH